MIGKMTSSRWTAARPEKEHGGRLLGTVLVEISDVTADEAVLIAQDLLGYLNEGKPSPTREQALPPEPIRPRIVAAGETRADTEAQVPTGRVVIDPVARTETRVKDDGIVERTKAVAESKAPDPSPSADASEDLTIFGRLTKVQDVVREVQRRGAKTFEEVKQKCIDLRDSEMCPVLSRVSDLETRLRTTCAALEIPGAV